MLKGFWETKRSGDFAQFYVLWLPMGSISAAQLIFLFKFMQSTLCEQSQTTEFVLTFRLTFKSLERSQPPE